MVLAAVVAVAAAGKRPTGLRPGWPDRWRPPGPPWYGRASSLLSSADGTCKMPLDSSGGKLLRWHFNLSGGGLAKSIGHVTSQYVKRDAFCFF